MNLHFTKMHGLGNDFMVLDLVRQPLQLQEAQVREWAQRQTGVGFDQLLVLEPASQPGCDFAYRIFNADGGEVEHCGNGARCITRFVIDKGLSSKRQLTFAMARGSIRCRLEDDGLVTVDMGVPVLEPERIPFTASARSLLYPLDVDGTLYEINAVSMGNPHAVLRVDNVDTAPVHALGPKLEHHPRFPQRVNVGFLQIVDRHQARLRVWERGAGETQACGTGACAAAVAAIRQGWMESPVQLELPGGRLSIEWAGPGRPVIMTGPAVRVYEGQIRL